MSGAAAGPGNDLNVLDLFSGIGGFSLGFEAAGMHTVAFCEVDPFCREWLAQCWPGVPIFPDVRRLDGRAVGPIDLVCGGFPCQDVSAAGKGEGLAGKRSGLWFEMLRIVREVRSTWVVIENVTALRTRGADRVLGDLEASGYTCWPFVVGADNLGATHRRKRVWIIGLRLADADRDALREFEQRLAARWADRVCDEGKAVARDDGSGMADAAEQPFDLGSEDDAEGFDEWAESEGSGSDLADPARELERTAADEADALAASRDARAQSGSGSEFDLADAARERTEADEQRGQRGRAVEVGDAVADAQGRGLRADGRASGSPGHSDERGAPLADSDRGGRALERLADDRRLEGEPRDIADGRSGSRPEDQRHGEALVHADGPGLEGFPRDDPARPSDSRGSAATHAGFRWPAGPGEHQHGWEAARTTSDAECRLGVSADGIPARLGATLNRARLKAAGNSVVPEVVYIVGRVIMDIEKKLRVK